jgi:hypothetical protein
MIELKTIKATHIDEAWRMGAANLAKACDVSGGEITGDQLKMILSRGERQLIAMVRDGEPAGWGVVRVDQLPNLRVCMVTDLYAPGAGFAEFLEVLKGWAKADGCTEVRCAAKPAQARLYARAGFEPVYTILKVMT